jgi:DivIVA domain-containing protein
MPDQSSAATEHAILQEITGPLAHLPDDALAVVNADFPTSLRGYDRVAVDEYVAQTRRLVAELQATRSPEAAVRRALERVGEQISGILQRAHETAEQITAQSRSEAEDRLQEVRAEAAHITRAAEERVRELDAETDRIWIERERIVADVEDLSAQLQALARRAADRFPDDDPVPPETALAGMPVEAGAPEHVPAEEGAPDPAGGIVREREPEDDPGPLAADGEDLDEDEIDATVPFVALDEDDSDEDTAVLPSQDAAPPASGGDEGDGPRASRLGRGPAGIRPASEAANRRLGR